MTAPTTLLIVGGGDHSLVLSAAERKATGTTQAEMDARVLGGDRGVRRGVGGGLGIAPTRGRAANP